MDYGIKLAKENSESNVNSTSPADYELWSKYPMLKVKKVITGTTTLVVDGLGDGSFDIEIDGLPTTFEPYIFATGDIYSALDDAVYEDYMLPYSDSNSTALLRSDYKIIPDSGKLYYRGSVGGGTAGSYSLDYKIIICYDKVT